MSLYGGIELGGTKVVCAVASGPRDLRDVERIPTTTPAETLGRVLAYFAERHATEPLAGIGIGSFGPLDLRPSSPTYGRIARTPKPGWSGVDLVGPVARALGVPVGFDTDVNAAALAEHAFGAGRGLGGLLYLTVGTGIGGGVVVRGEPLHGLVHPEMGHLRIPREPDDVAAFRGACPFHGDCLEGLASGPALARRWGRPAESLERGHAAWELEARHLALALASFVCTLSPERIVLGGGVIGDGWLLPDVRERLRTLLAGYVDTPSLTEELESYVVVPDLGDRAGVLGAIALAARAAGRPLG